MKEWLKSKLHKSLGINELEETMHNGFEHILNSVRDSNISIALIDGRMRELELALRLLSVKECADYLDVSTGTVKNRLNDGELIGRKVGYTWVITKLELLRYENRVKAEKDSE